MSLLYEPPPTEYDIEFSCFGIPVRIHPLFWLISILFGIRSGSLSHILIWVFAVFISVLIHELGHSFMMRYFGRDSYIVLHFAGGLAVPTTSVRSAQTRAISQPNQQILISLAGPFAGFAFATAIVLFISGLGGFVSINWLWGFIPFPIAFLETNEFTLVNSLIGSLLWVNIFWGLMNLMPVYPLDGGQATRQVFIQLDPWGGIRKSLWLSVIVGSTIAILGFALLNSWYMAFLFGALAAQSYQRLY